MIRLRRLNVAEWPLWREMRLEALREAPHAFGSKLTDWEGARDTEERWRKRLAEVPFKVIAELDNRPAGMVGATFASPQREVELISMWVAPFARGRGVGDCLIGAVIGWAKEQEATSVLLDVMEDNLRATALYNRHGFIDRGSVPNASPADPSERRMARNI